MPKERMIYLKRLLVELKEHRKDIKNSEGKEIKACDDKRVFCPYEKQKLYELLMSILNELKEINQQYPLKETEKNEGGK